MRKQLHDRQLWWQSVLVSSNVVKWLTPQRVRYPDDCRKRRAPAHVTTSHDPLNVVRTFERYFESAVPTEASKRIAFLLHWFRNDSQQRLTAEFSRFADTDSSTRKLFRSASRIVGDKIDCISDYVNLASSRNLTWDPTLNSSEPTVRCHVWRIVDTIERRNCSPVLTIHSMISNGYVCAINKSNGKIERHTLPRRNMFDKNKKLWKTDQFANDARCSNRRSYSFY